MAVRIYLEIGHEASIRTKKTQEGFTHDWEVFVRGCDGAEIQYYIEKVVFYLHETFPKPKRVVKEPPYSVKESGYAGFNLPIEIYLRNSSEPKKIRFNYDLHLQQSGPPIIKVQKEKYIFNNPLDDFKIKLLKGGAIVGSSSSMQDVSDSRSSLDDKNQMTNKPKLSGSEFAKKQKIKIGEPCRDFQELFGSPINMSAKTSEQKLVIKQDNKGLDKARTKHSPHKEGHKEKEKSKEKSESDKKNREEKKQKEKSKDRERSKDKSLKKEKSPRPKSPSPKRSPKRSSPSRFSSPPVNKHKESNKHDKEKRDKAPDERKPKKEKKNKEHKENKHVEEKQEDKEVKMRTERKEEVKMKSETSPPPPKLEKKEKSSKEKASKESLKEDRHSEKYKHKKKDKEKREKKEDKQYKSDKKSEKTPEPKPNFFKSEPPVLKKEKINFPTPVQPMMNEDESSNSSTSSSNSSIPERVEKKKSEIKIKEEKNQKVKKEKGYQENSVKCKRKSNSVEAEEPPEKMTKEQVQNNSDAEQETKPVVIKQEDFEEDYFGILRDLQHKIMGIKDNNDLQKVVKLIADTGRYEVSANTFDFDLCLLDRSTVQQLQDFFANET